jgi:hypothetical protein
MFQKCFFFLCIVLYDTIKTKKSIFSFYCFTKTWIWKWERAFKSLYKGNFRNQVLYHMVKKTIGSISVGELWGVARATWSKKKGLKHESRPRTVRASRRQVKLYYVACCMYSKIHFSLRGSWSKYETVVSIIGKMKISCSNCLKA